MLIRISSGSGGFANYLKTGAKQGREHTRDELDERVHLHGNLDRFEEVTQRKNWKQKYKHITASFSPDEQHLIDENPEMLKELSRDIVQYMLGPGIDLDRVEYYVEYHKPKLHSEIGADGEVKERLGHLHIGLALLDVENDKQFAIAPSNIEAESAFQTHLCYKYGLVDPIDRQRTEDKKNILQSYKGDVARAETIKGIEGKARAYYSELLKGVSSIDEITDRINSNDFPYPQTVELNTKGRDPKLVVNLEIGGAIRKINLRGQGFDDVVKTVVGEERYKELVDTGKHKPNKEALTANKKREKLSPEAALAKVEERNLWMYEHKNLKLQPDCKRIYKYDMMLEQKGKKIEPPKPKKNSMTEKRLEKTLGKFKSYYDTKSSEQRVYWKVFGSEIREELVKGFKIAGNDGGAKLINHEKSIYINEKDNLLTVEDSMKGAARKDAVEILLQRAMEKGADITKLEVIGSAEFKAEVRSQVNEIVAKDDYKAPLEASNTVTLQEVGDKKPSATSNAAAESGRALASAIANSKIGVSEMDTITGNSVEIGEHDDAWTIFLKISRYWEGFYKELEAQNEKLLRESLARNRERLAKMESFAQSFVSNLSRMFNNHVRNHLPIKTLSLASVKDTSGATNRKDPKVGFKNSKTAYDQLKAKAVDKIAKQENKADLVALNKLDPNEVLKFAQGNNGLLFKNYEVTMDNKIRDLRNPNAAPKSNIDFLSKTCCMSFTDAVAVLSEISKDLDAKKAQEVTQVLKSEIPISEFLANVSSSLPDKERKIEASVHKRDKEYRARKEQGIRDRRGPKNCQTLFESLTKLQQALITNYMSYQKVSLHEYMTSDLIRGGVTHGNAFEYFLNSVQSKPNCEISFDQNGDLVIKRYKLDGGTIALDL